MNTACKMVFNLDQSRARAAVRNTTSKTSDQKYTVKKDRRVSARHPAVKAMSPAAACAEISMVYTMIRLLFSDGGKPQRWWDQRAWTSCR